VCTAGRGVPHALTKPYGVIDNSWGTSVSTCLGERQDTTYLICVTSCLYNHISVIGEIPAPEGAAPVPSMSGRR
jgi:hypothetical protein